MKHFSTLFKTLDETNKTTKKVDALALFFDEANDQDKLWAIALLSHKRPKRIVSTSLLREWASEISEIPLWLFEECYHVVGDLAETIAHLTQKTGTSDKSLSEWIHYLESLRGKEIDEVKLAIQTSWCSLDATERFIFNKLITGGFRFGVSQKLMTKGLAQSTGQEEKELTHKLMGNWDPFKINYQELIHGENKEFDNARPFPFFLAYPITNS